MIEEGISYYYTVAMSQAEVPIAMPNAMEFNGIHQVTIFSIALAQGGKPF